MTDALHERLLTPHPTSSHTEAAAALDRNNSQSAPPLLPSAPSPSTSPSHDDSDHGLDSDSHDISNARCRSLLLALILLFSLAAVLLLTLSLLSERLARWGSGSVDWEIGIHRICVRDQSLDMHRCGTINWNCEVVSRQAKRQDRLAATYRVQKQTEPLHGLLLVEFCVADVPDSLSLRVDPALPAVQRCPRRVRTHACDRADRRVPHCAVPLLSTKMEA